MKQSQKRKNEGRKTNLKEDKKPSESQRDKPVVVKDREGRD